jgi:hypothetical protein
MPVDPIDEQILARVAERLSAIQAGATYFYTPGEVARDWKNWDEVRSWPFYGVIEGELSRAETTMTTVEVTLPVTIVGWVRSDDARRTVLNRACADVIRAIYTDESWGGLALITKVTRRATDEAALVAKPHGYFELMLEILYHLDRTAA